MFDFEAACADVIDVSLGLHRQLGAGLLETVYEALLAAKLQQTGYKVERQRPIAIEFEGVRIEGAFRADLVLGGELIIEVKSVEQLNGVHAKQLLTYLRLTKQPLGLLINFGGETLKGQVRRIANNYTPLAPSRLRVNQLSGAQS